MRVRVFQTAASRTYTYSVVRGLGNNFAYEGGIGTVTIIQTRTQTYPYYVSGQATMTFTASILRRQEEYARQIGFAH
jgi:hypothetical protein